MPDVWTAVQDLDRATQERLADVLEKRGADAQQHAMRRAFLQEVRFPQDARVLDVGCGTGVLTRVLARWPAVRSVIGVDPAPALLEKARVAAADLPNVSFQEGDGRSLPFDGEMFDVVTSDSMLSHVPGPERAIGEAFRVLRAGGCLAVFDGDYATTTVALADHDVGLADHGQVVDARGHPPEHHRPTLDLRRPPAGAVEAGPDELRSGQCRVVVTVAFHTF